VSMAASKVSPQADGEAPDDAGVSLVTVPYRDVSGRKTPASVHGEGKRSVASGSSFV
jgi:hypothetical protein